MALQVIRLKRCAALGKIDGACAYDAAYGADMAGNKAAIGQLADAECNIDMLLRQIGDAV